MTFPCLKINIVLYSFNALQHFQCVSAQCDPILDFKYSFVVVLEMI